MRPQRSTKYRMHRRSKYEYPTVVPRQKGQTAPPGHERALKDVERQLARRLKDGTKTAHTRSEWIWKEPR